MGKKNTANLIFVIFMGLALSGCGFLNQTMQIRSTPDGAECIAYNNKNDIAFQTPAEITVVKGFNNLHIECQIGERTSSVLLPPNNKKEGIVDLTIHLK